jgi:hypothetical protein
MEKLFPEKLIRLSFDKAFDLALKKYGSELGMFGRLLTKGGSVIPGKYISYGMFKVITKEELLS